MRVLYRHSEEAYRKIDQGARETLRLAQKAAEAILSKGWTTFRRGGLPRDATGWQGAEAAQAESALDHLIELGWIRDITPPVTPGKRGRRSSGVFEVHPEAHRRFRDHVSRFSEARRERFEAMQAITE